MGRRQRHRKDCARRSRSARAGRDQRVRAHVTPERVDWVTVGRDGLPRDCHLKARSLGPRRWPASILRRARWRQAEEFLDQHGMVYPLRDEKGNVRCMQQFPQVSIARNLLLLIRSFLQEFGMTPAARTRIELPWEPPVQASGDGVLVTDRLGRPM